jgi:hypothetical protein
MRTLTLCRTVQLGDSLDSVPQYGDYNSREIAVRIAFV